MSESESEYEEEEMMVLVELNGVIDSEIFTQNNFNKFKVLGIETNNPVLQLENFVFSGEYKQTMGTALVLEEGDKKVKKCDPVFCKKPSKRLKYICKTNKTLEMNRVFVSEKHDKCEELNNDSLDKTNLDNSNNQINNQKTNN